MNEVLNNRENSAVDKSQQQKAAEEWMTVAAMESMDIGTESAYDGYDNVYISSISAYDRAKNDNGDKAKKTLNQILTSRILLDGPDYRRSI